MDWDRPLGWKDLLRGGNAARTLVLAGGVGLHATNIFIANTILPSIVAEIGGLDYYAWNTTLFVIGSIVGSASIATLLGRLGPRRTYGLAAGLFLLGAFACAAAPSMLVLLAGRAVQGLGGGAMVGLSYATIRHLFPAQLWSRAIALVSGVWGIAALAGPFLGGVFAEAGAWRAAFGALVPVTLAFAVLARHVLRRAEAPAGGRAMPVLRLAVLALAVLAVSSGSIAAGPGRALLGLGISLALIAVLGVLDSGRPGRLLPHAIFRPATPLGAVYATMVLLMIGTTSIIFVPYLLQTLHGLSPIEAGYMTVLESFGWTAASLATSSFGPRWRDAAMTAGPVVAMTGLAGLAVSFGQPDMLGVIAVCLFLAGGGIGMGWAHFGSTVLAVAPVGERDLAASSISTIQLLAVAFGSAFAGMVANLVGLTDPASTIAAARWLFASFSLASGLGLVTVLTLIARRPAVLQ